MAMMEIFIRAHDQATNVVQGIGKSMEGTGRTLTRTLTPAAAALGLAFKKAFDEFDAGVDALRVGTGATGDELKTLEKSMKRVGGRVTQGLGQTGQVMADLAKRTDLTGDALEDMTKKILDLERIGQPASVQDVTRLFGDWGIATDDQSDALDRVFRASQATGAGVGQLSQLMVQFGTPLRKVGFEFDKSIAMFGRFEQAGVNIQTTMPGIRMALKNFAKAGKDPAKGLEQTFKQLQKFADAGDAAAAESLAFEVFGVRAGPDLSGAVLEGKLALDDLVNTMVNGEDTIDKAAEDTLDLGDKFAMLKNRVVGVIGPFGEVGAVLFGMLASLGPALLGISAIAPAFKRGGGAAKFFSGVIGLVGKALTFLAANPVVLIALAIAALAFLIVKNWSTVKAWTGKLVGWVVGFFKKLGSFLLNWTVIGRFVKLIIDNFDKIKSGVGAAIDFIIGLFDKLKVPIEWILDKLGAVAGVIGKVGGVIGGIVSKIPGFAHGGPIRAGQLGIVGERGPELFVPRMSGRIVPNNRLAAMGAGGLTIVIEGDVFGFDDFADKVDSALTKLVRSKGGL